MKFHDVNFVKFLLLAGLLFTAGCTHDEDKTPAEHACESKVSDAERKTLDTAVTLDAHKLYQLVLSSSSSAQGKYEGQVKINVRDKHTYQFFVSSELGAFEVLDASGQKVEGDEKESINVKSCSLKNMYELDDLKVGEYTLKFSGSADKEVYFIYFKEHKEGDDHDHDHAH